LGQHLRVILKSTQIFDVSWASRRK